jgi:antirestriction protein ArdC
VHIREEVAAQTSGLCESATNKLIADLENGAVPWTRPWEGGNSGGIMPINAATRRHYTGINVLIPWSARDEHGHPSPQWMTFKQAIKRRLGAEGRERRTRHFRQEVDV